MDGPHQGSRPQFTKWTDPTRVINLYKSTKVDRLHQVSRPVHKVNGPDQGHKLIQIHKVDRLHQRSRPQSTKWTGLTRVTNLYKSTKWMDSTKGQDHSPQSGRTQPGSQTFTKSPKWMDPTKGQDQSTKWTDPPRVKTIANEVDGPSKGKKLKYPQSG